MEKNEYLIKLENAKRVTEELLRRPIAYHPIVAKAFGSVKLAVLWSQLYYWSDKTKDADGWIYKTREEIYSETGLVRKEQETARKIAQELGVIDEKLAGMPPKMHFRVNMDASIKIISKFVGKEDRPETEFNWEETLQKMEDSERADMNVIAFFFRKKKLSFDTKEQYQVALRRHLRAAKEVITFNDEQVEKAAKDAEQQYPGSWTLETLVKLLTKKKY